MIRAVAPITDSDAVARPRRFRIDTAKHVNTEFWQLFSPAMLETAAKVGNDDFFMFGEVFDADPAFQSIYSTTTKLPAIRPAKPLVRSSVMPSAMWSCPRSPLRLANGSTTSDKGGGRDAASVAFPAGGPAATAAGGPGSGGRRDRLHAPNAAARLAASRPPPAINRTRPLRRFPGGASAAALAAGMVMVAALVVGLAARVAAAVVAVVAVAVVEHGHGVPDRVSIYR